MKVLITIPAYNEEDTISSVIEEIKSVMDNSDYNYDLLVLNDGSIDKTAEIAEKVGAIVISNKRNLGLAKTFKKEMKECLKLDADIIVHTDADGQYPAEVIPKLIKKVEEGNDLVLGSRFSKGVYHGSIIKKLGNIAFAKIFSNLLKIKITDTTTGFRAFTDEIAKLPLINNFTYTQEQLIRVGKEKMKIGEIPIITNKTRPSRLFKNSFDYALKAWINIFRIYRDFEPLKFFGRIGGIFILLGFLLGVYIAGRIWIIGNAGGVPKVILSMLLILVGVQIALFGFLADMKEK